MNKTQLIDVIADKAELSKTQAKAALESTLAAITALLQIVGGDKLIIPFC